jgi:NAD(P)-dependent dehydrogenase (short-subunit alcohol dehydrogenase family)
LAVYDYNGKVAIVTGGGSGIGEATALTMGRSGAKVMVADYDKEAGDRVTEAIKTDGGEATFVAVDVSNRDEVETMVKTTVETYGGLHVAVNNAGIGGAQALTADYPVESWDQVIAVNLSSVFYGMKYQIPAMIESGGGSIINMASILGSVGFAQSVAYVAAKHGVVGMTKSAAIEYSAQGVRVNSVGPGFIKTPLLEKNLDAETMDALVGLHPIGRLGEAQEVADLVTFLGSDAAYFCTGGYYLVDGAYTAN